MCGGGARLPSAAAQAARWGLAGLEFGINIPGTVGGAVKMNANAYGGELGRVLESVTLHRRGRRATPAGELGFPIAARTSAPARSSPGPPSAGAGDVAEIKGGLAEMRGKRRRRSRRDQDLRLDLQEPSDDPRAKGMTAGQLLEAAGCRGLRVGGARFSEKHANFVENVGGATTADILELMAEGRRRSTSASGSRWSRRSRSWARSSGPRLGACATDSTGAIQAGAAPGERESPSCDVRRHACRQAARQRAHRPSPARYPSAQESSAARSSRPLEANRVAVLAGPRALLAALARLVRRRALLAAVLLVAWRSATSAGFGLSLVAVRDVEVQGVSGADRERIVAELTDAARGMSTLHVDTDRLRDAIREFPGVAAVSADASIPHGITIQVIERQPT